MKAAKRTPAQLEREIAASLRAQGVSDGTAKPTVISRRKTSDDKTVSLWNDGSLTWGIGSVIKGSPNARTPRQIQEAIAAGWLVLGEVELYDADEVPRLIEVARKVARKGGLPGDVRAEFAKSAPLRPIWTVLESDRSGRPTVRVWQLPRITHPGMAIWDTARNASRGRYEVMTVMRGHHLGRRHDGGTYDTTGVRFHDLGKLAAYLRETSQLRGGG